MERCATSEQHVSSRDVCCDSRHDQRQSRAIACNNSHLWHGQNILSAPLSASAYNPANGQIANLSYSYDLKHYTVGQVAYSILVYQSNTYYYHVPNDLTSSNVPWTNFKGSNLTAASFTKLAGPSSNANPDFSCAGSPIVFGYVTVNSNTIPGW